MLLAAEEVAALHFALEVADQFAQQAEKQHKEKVNQLKEDMTALRWAHVDEVTFILESYCYDLSVPLNLEMPTPCLMS